MTDWSADGQAAAAAAAAPPPAFQVTEDWAAQPTESSDWAAQSAPVGETAAPANSQW